MLTEQDRENILSEFPNIKLSYENITHKKVYNSDLLIGIPEGNKCFVWFTFYNEKPVCLFLEKNQKKKNCEKKSYNIKLITACYSETLCYGTIFYGTRFYHMGNKFFSIEDIFLYKGETYFRENWINKIKVISDILKKDINQISYNNSFVVFGLPIIANTHKIFEDNIKNNIKYKLASIQYRNFYKTNNYLVITYDNFLKIDDEILHLERPITIQNENINKSVKEINTKTQKIDNKIITDKYIDKQNIFTVKPDIQNDVYHLYLDIEYKGLACVPDYKTSVMLNNLFRNIKENNDLDALEESDDDEEFENPNIDKFVYLDRTFKMICNFNKKFKKWVPIKLHK
jgi:hypothetical protein